MKITIGRKDGEPLSFDAHPGEKVLHAALRNKLVVPYECATGTCGSCRAKLVNGDLSPGWVDAPGRKALKVARGEFLMCQCVAQTDCDIRIPAKVTVQESTLPLPQHLTGRIGGFSKLTPDVISFEVTLDHEVGFQAGQFMVLQLPDIEGTRAYSMVNFATRTNYLDFVIKQFKGGKGSSWFFDQSPQDCEVSLFGPLGHAVFEPHLEHDLLLLAGGSGIAGMMAILQHADQIGYLQTNNIDLIFGVRSVPDIFYLPVLRAHASKYPESLRISLALSDEPDSADAPAISDQLSDLPANLKITRGFVHEHIDDARANANTMAFIAGPPPMVDASIREIIVGKGFSTEQIRYDKFA